MYIRSYAMNFDIATQLWKLELTIPQIYQQEL